MRLLVARVGSRRNAESGGSPVAGDINPSTLVKPSPLQSQTPQTSFLSPIPPQRPIFFKVALFWPEGREASDLPFFTRPRAWILPYRLILGLGLGSPRFELSVSLTLHFQLFYSLGCLEGSLVIRFSGSPDASLSFFRPIISPILGLERSGCRLAHRLANRLITRWSLTWLGTTRMRPKTLQ